MRSNLTDIEYRPDIDGLRAIAVALVLVCHLGIPYLQGGFIGVDVFFVISGYLITGNIARNIERETFSISGFYERRFRRIAPALFVLLFATTVMAYLIFLPADLVQYGHALVAAALSYSNIYFYKARTGYFGASYTNILLHTWSLGVEEQFYLVIPLWMSSTGDRTRLRRGTMILAALVSFLLAAYLTFKNRDLAFYMPYTRAWELLAGSFAALGIIPAPRTQASRKWVSAASILVLLACAVLFSPMIPFPGISALLPCAATLGLIQTGGGPKTPVSSMLQWRPVVFVGLISYSLYLWHWPVIVLMRLGVINGLRDRTMSGGCVVALLSFVLAYLSWRFVEQPLRVGNLSRSPRYTVFAGVGACALVLTFFAVMFDSEHGIGHRFSTPALEIGSYINSIPEMRAGSCFVETGFSQYNKPQCLLMSPDKSNVLLFGDSHAAALWWGLNKTLTQTNILQATLAACPPTRGQYRRSPCSQMRRYIYEDFLPNNQLDGIILTQRWTSVQDLDRLQPALEWLQQRKVPVIVVGPVPEYTAPLPFLLAEQIRWENPQLADGARVTSLGELDREIAKQLKDRPGIAYVSAWHAICPEDFCREYADDQRKVPLQADLDHLTNAGSTYLFKTLQKNGNWPLR
jgi:peptidoglycan/LPS O-acetylase OafA/YrhL